MQRLTAQLRHLIGRRHGAQHGKIGTTPDIGGQSYAHPCLRQAHKVKKTRSDKGVGGWAMHHRGADFGQLVDLARLKMDGMTIKAARAQQAELRIGLEIVARLWKQAAHPGDFFSLLGQVSLHQAVWTFLPQPAQGGELLWG